MWKTVFYIIAPDFSYPSLSVHHHKGETAAMFQKKPRIFFALIVTLFILGTCGNSLATSITVNNLMVTVKSEKSRYDVADTAIVTVEVTNLNDFPVLDVNAEAILGKGLILAKGSEVPPTKEIIIPEEKAQFVFNLSLFEIPALGDSQNQLMDILLLIAGITILLVVFFLNWKRIKERILPMLLCLILISLTMPIAGLAQEANEQLNTVSLNIYFGTTSYPFSAKITYGAIDSSLSLGTLKSDEEFFPTGGEYPVLFTLPVISARTLGDQDVAVYDGDGNRIAYLNDKGLNGDEFAGDYIFSSSAKVSAKVQTNRSYYGAVKGSMSNALRFYFFDEITPEENKMLESVSSHINNIVIAPFVKDGYTIPDKAEQALEAVAAYALELQNQGHLILVESDQESVWMKFSSGLELLYVNTFQDVLGSTGAVRMQVSTFEPVNHEFPSKVPDEAAKLVSRTFSNYSFTTNLDDKAVTLEAIQNNFKPNSLILWVGHGGYNKRIHSTTWTSLKYSTLTSKQNEDDKKQGLIIKSTKTDNTGLTIKYFSKYLGSLKNSVIYLNTCSGGKDDFLANVFLKKGATAFIANTNITSVGYAYAMMESTVEALVKKNPTSFQYYTLKEALDEAKDKNEFLRVISFLQSFATGKAKIFGGTNAYNHRLYEDTSIGIGTLSGRVLLYPKTAGYKPAPIQTPLSEPAYLANVSLVNQKTYKLTASTTVDVLGNFELTAPEGIYSLKISPRKLGSIESHLSLETQINIVKGACTNLGTFTLIPRPFFSSKGTLSGKAINANNGNSIDGVNIIIRNGWNNPNGTIATKTATNTTGEYSLPLNPGYYTLTAQKNGFITSTKSITVNSDGQEYTDFSMTPASLEDSYRIVLNWGKTPRDLDAHVAGLTQSGQSIHVYYNNKSASDNRILVCDLDVDDTNSYGPETVTIKPQHLEPYYYYVYNFSNDDSITNSQAKVELFKGNKLTNTFHVPVNQGDGRYWNLFAIVNGGIVINNTVSSERNISYAD